MQPTNQSDRKSSIWRFVGLFLLAVLPVCLSVYLLARVDAVENKYLIPRVQQQQVVVAQSEDLKRAKDEYKIALRDLQDIMNVTAQSPYTNNSGEIENSLNDLQRALNDVTSTTTSEESDEYISFLAELQEVLVTLNRSVYREVVVEMNRFSEELDECDEKVDELKRELGYN